MVKVIGEVLDGCIGFFRVGEIFRSSVFFFLEVIYKER